MTVVRSAVVLVQCQEYREVCLQQASTLKVGKACIPVVVKLQEIHPHAPFGAAWTQLQAAPWVVVMMVILLVAIAFWPARRFQWNLVSLESLVDS